MSGGFPLLKKPKFEILQSSEEEPEEESEEEEVESEEEPDEENDDATAEERRRDEELVLSALIDHRKKEVEHLRQRITYYQSQLDEAEKKLEDTMNKLACVRRRNIKMESRALTNGRDEATVAKSSSPVKMTNGSSQKWSQSAPLHQNHVTTESTGSQRKTQARPPLVIPSVNPNVLQALKAKEPGNNFSSSGFQLTSSTHVTEDETQKACKTSSGPETIDAQAKGTKRKLDEQEHRDLIQLIGKKSSPVTVRCHTACPLPSNHKRKLRSLVLCPTNDQLFMTSALDGVVNLWQVEGRGSSANLLSSTDCQSDKQRRWPEDIAWHPLGDKLFSVYIADAGDSQVSILNLNKGKTKAARLSFLKHKPHTKGVINSIMFMPWDDESFVTGGSDHSVFLWSDKDGEDSWKPKLLHRDHHSSAVMGVAGLRHKNIVMSAGADKQIVGFDTLAGKLDYKHQIDSKCMSVVPSPVDFNLFMVHAGTHGRQLRLFDIRERHIEVHAFGWKPETSESHSALIHQAWSPDGLYITSGSADPIIHIFDIRYNSDRPSQSIKTHQKRVFKAAWHHSLPLLISISSDLNIGLHKIT